MEMGAGRLIERRKGRALAIACTPFETLKHRSYFPIIFLKMYIGDEDIIPPFSILTLIFYIPTISPASPSPPCSSGGKR